MNKQEKIIVGILFLALVAWMALSPRPQQPPAEQPGPADAPAEKQEVAQDTTVNPPTVEQPTAKAPRPPADPGNPASEVDIPEPAAPPEAPPAIVESDPLPPEIIYELRNEDLVLSLTTHGAALRSAEIEGYRQSLDLESGPLVFDFDESPALALEGLAEFGKRSVYTLKSQPSDEEIVFTASRSDGLRIQRRLAFTDAYRIEVEETFVNEGKAEITIPRHGLALGAMEHDPHLSSSLGPQIAYLGIDTLRSQGGEKVHHWNKKRFFSSDPTIPDFFLDEERRGVGCVRSMMMGKSDKQLPLAIEESFNQDTDWAAVKTKFFVQILAPEEPADGFVMRAERLLSENGEDPNNPATWARSAVLKSVSATLQFQATALQPGDRHVRKLNYYVGPKKQSTLKSATHHQEDVMEFGKLKIICEPLLWTMNKIHAVLPNYGVAIILLTIIIKVIFWPVTHKSSEHMKRMSQLQPLIKEIQAKHKDQPEKMQKAMMAMYKEHKVNPMAGCLPMVIQIPVFFGLFTVLRSAVELRYASFLWIPDLSEPEGLFSTALASVPMIDALNILPLVMTAMTILQQKLTPTTGDPQQKRMMMMMPVVFLFLFYNMASGLVLYWTVSQILSIVQLAMQQRSTRLEAAEKSS